MPSGMEMLIQALVKNLPPEMMAGIQAVPKIAQSIAEQLKRIEDSLDRIEAKLDEREPAFTPDDPLPTMIGDGKPWHPNSH